MIIGPGPVLLVVSVLALATGPVSGPAPSSGSGQVPQATPYSTLLDAARDGGFDAEGVKSLTKGLSLRARDAAGAAREFGQAADRLPGLRDWALLLQAESTAKSGDTAAVRVLLDRIEPGLVVVRGWRARVDACRAARDARCAAAESALALDRAPDPTVRAAAATSLGNARLLLADTTGAMAAFRVAIDAAAGSEAALEAGRALSGLRTATVEDRLALGRLFFRHANADRGIAGFDAWLRAGRGTAAERGAIKLELAKSLLAARRYATAETRLVALVRERVSPALTAEAEVSLGRTRLRMGKLADGVRTLESAIRDPATPPAALAEALFLLGDAEEDRGGTARARELYTRLLTDHPATPEGADAAMRLGGAAFAAGRHAEAAGIFDRFRVAHERGPRAQQALYWAAWSHLIAGDTAIADSLLAATRTADPTSYYGLRAAERLAQPLRPTLAASPASDPAAARLAKGAVARMALLREARVDGGVALELGRARRYIGTRDDGLYAIAEALNAGGLPIDAVRLGREIQRSNGGWNERLLRIVYPLPYRDEIVAAARRRGLDPWFVAGLIRQESLFLPDARSSAGAVGLMQVLPSTGRDLARRDGLPGFAPAMLTDPAVNIRLGTLFVAELLDRHGGNKAYALAAYNAGPSRVTRWLRLPDNGNPDVFAERIPFPETRDYVRIVQQNARIYAELYGLPDDGIEPRLN